MAEKLIIPLDGRTEQDIDCGGEVTFIGWDRLRKLLEPTCDVDEDEVIAGFTIRKDGITIKIETITT